MLETPPPPLHSAKGLLHTFPPSSHAQPVTSLHSSLRNQKQPGQAADPCAHSPRGSVRCIHVPTWTQMELSPPPSRPPPPPEPHPTSLLSWINPSAQKHPVLPGPPGGKGALIQPGVLHSHGSGKLSQPLLPRTSSQPTWWPSCYPRHSVEMLSLRPSIPSWHLSCAHFCVLPGCNCQGQQHSRSLPPSSASCTWPPGAHPCLVLAHPPGHPVSQTPKPGWFLAWLLDFFPMN